MYVTDSYGDIKIKCNISTIGMIKTKNSNKNQITCIKHTTLFHRKKKFITQ